MKTRRKFSAAKKARIGSYLSACAAWAASNSNATAEIIHGYFDTVGQQPIVFDRTDDTYSSYIFPETPLDPVANLLILPVPDGTNANLLNANIVGFGADVNGNFQDLDTDFTFNTTGPTIRLQTDYYGAAFVRYTDGQTIDGSSFIRQPGPSDSSGYLFDFNSDNSAAFNNSAPPYGQFVGQTSGYIGFAFTGADPNNIGQSTIYTGWVFISNIAADYSSFSILDWAYTAGSTIEAGDAPVNASASVPEPSSLGLLAVGAAGLARYRRRRQAPKLAADATPAA